MAVKALSYIGVNSDKLDDWSDYSENVWVCKKLIEAKGLYLLEWTIINKD